MCLYLEVNKIDQGLTNATKGDDQRYKCVKECSKPLVNSTNQGICQCVPCSSKAKYYEDKNCKIKCSEDYFLGDEKQNICSKCPDSCKKCENSTGCLECENNTALFVDSNNNKFCYHQCPDGYYKGKKFMF